MGIEDEKKVLAFTPREDSRSEAEIRQGRIRSAIALIQKETETPFTNADVPKAEESLAPYEITELEQQLLKMPTGWSNFLPYWVALVNVLERKYQERDRMQTP